MRAAVTGHLCLTSKSPALAAEGWQLCEEVVAKL